MKLVLQLDQLNEVVAFILLDHTQLNRIAIAHADGGETERLIRPHLDLQIQINFRVEHNVESDNNNIFCD